MVDIREVVVPVDGSENAKRAAEFGSRLAHAAGKPLRLLFVFSVVGDEIVGLAGLSKEQIDAAMHRAARRVFDEIRGELGDAATDSGELVLYGDPAEEILEFVQAHPESLVVMGRRGKGPIERVLLGSVCDKVVRHAAGAITLVS